MSMYPLTHRTYSENSHRSSCEGSALVIKKALSKISLESKFRMNIASQISSGFGATQETN